MLSMDQSVQRRATGWSTEVRFPTGSIDLFLYSTSFRTALRPHAVSYPVSTASHKSRGSSVGIATSYKMDNRVVGV
jgi:hypothetical protein